MVQQFKKLTYLIPLVLALLIGAMPALSQTLPAASDGSEVWLVRRTEGGIAVIHRDFARTTSQLRKVYERQGELAPAGFAAEGGDAWLVYKSPSGLLFQSIRIEVPYEMDARRFADDYVGRSLAGDVQLWSIDVTSVGPWVLLRALSARGLSDIDDAIARDRRPMSTAMPSAKNSLTPVVPTPPSQVPADSGDAVEHATVLDAEPDASGEMLTHRDRLLVLKQGRWVDGTLPADWPEEARKWVVTREFSDATPTLMTLMPAADDTQQLRIYEWKQAAWQRQDHDLPAVRDAVPLAVDGQLLLACVQVASSPAGSDIMVYTVLPEGVHPIGSLGAVPTGGSETWTVLPIGSTIARITRANDDAVDVEQIDLLGQKVSPIVVPPVSLVDSWKSAGWLPVVLCIAVALPLLLYYWRKSPDGEGLKLPKEVVPADLMRRMIAVIFDMVPAVVIALQAYSIPFSELLQRVPGRNVSLEKTGAYLLVVGIFFLHTVVTEALTGRTLGKYFMNLRVTQLNGQRATVAQVLIRNLLKIVELIAWPLMAAPLMRPIARQRLGDLVAKTIVVAPREPDEDAAE
jgi:uncharacterized RDD family membrane protein YckC